MIRSTGISQGVHVARKGAMNIAYKILIGKPEENRHLENLGVNVRLILNGS
jgi:hypothetical protein